MITAPPFLFAHKKIGTSVSKEYKTIDDFDLENVSHFQPMEEIVDVLVRKTANTDKNFFRIEVAYFMGKMASSMRAVVNTKDRGEIPINIYALALAVSGAGKGHSIGILENSFLSGFKQTFLEVTYPMIAERQLWTHAARRAARNGTSDQDEYEKVSKEFADLGPLAFTFDSGTTPAVKQLRQQLLIAECGSINFQVDEIGSNLVSSTDVLNTFLELYDQGMVKPKLTKNTSENRRSKEIDGKTPANMLLFGTPTKLLDGAKTEEDFYSFLETGYARRCLFGFGHRMRASHQKTVKEIYHDLTDSSVKNCIDKWHNTFQTFAEEFNYGWKVDVPDDIGIMLLSYKIICEEEADLLPEHEEIKKAELSHRYFKALKLAGTFTFVDRVTEMREEHLLAAIKLVEESGKAFQDILSREKSYVKLAKYLASVGSEQTHADLHEALPFYKAGTGARNEMMMMAMAWGYRQHIIIKKTFIDGIEFFQGEPLIETDLRKMTLSHSAHYAENYRHEIAPFNQLHKLIQLPNYNWCNHAFKEAYRLEENVIPGFNMVVLDVDGGTPLAHAAALLEEYTFLMYTTKRHTQESNRFRIILPLDYNLKLDSKDYLEFMHSIVDWLPFKVDESTNQRSRKWLTNTNTQYIYNEGRLLESLKFVPKTSKNEQYKTGFQQIENLGNLERWFAQRIAEGNRNNNLLKFAMALVDSGLSYTEIEGRVITLNQAIENPLSEDELRSTILTTVAKRLSKG